MDGFMFVIIVLVFVFTLLPMVIGYLVKKRYLGTDEEEGALEEVFSEMDLDMENDEMEREFEESIIIEADSYVKPEIKVSPTVVKADQEENVQKGELLGRGMSKEDKRKLIIYSEVMSPKYKEY